MKDMDNKIQSYRDLIVWQKAMDVVVIIYDLTEKFPVSENHGLTFQMRRAAVSIPSNIAEGRRRGSKKEFRRFLMIAFASGSELETQIEISKRLSITSANHYLEVDTTLLEVMKMLNRLIFSLKS
jgi:four helix bundle protein